MSQNNWKALPALQTARCECAAFTLNDVLIYCLCGYNSISGDLNTMEIMSVKSGSKWDYVNVTNMFSARAGIHGLQMSENEVIVFGANPSNSECYVLCIKKTVISVRVADLAEGSVFFMCASPLLDGVCVYGSDYNRRIHIYSLANKNWEMIG